MSKQNYIIEKHLSQKENKLILRNPQSKNSDHLTSIPFSESYKIFKEIARSSQLFLNDKSIVIDLFGRAEFYYKVELNEGKNSVKGYLKTASEEFPIEKCDFISGGPPHFFIKGFSLKFIGTSLSFKELRGAYEGNYKSIAELEENAKADAEAPKVFFLGDSHLVNQIEREPLPLLILKDRSGAFADLWMDYHLGEKQWVPFHRPHDPLSNGQKRQFAVEKTWEKDLLETDYTKKIVDTTHYYCPLDKVAKSLAFLLELGWKIFDHLGNRIIPHQNFELNAAATDNAIVIKGKVNFESYQADVSTIVGAFNRREKFVQLAEGVVGLMPNHFNNLDSLLEESEIIGNSLQLKKNRFGMMADFLDSSQLQLDTTLVNLKEKLISFKGITESLPGKDFAGQLRPYQQEGLNWLSFLYDYGFHGILADDMGLGKTVQVLAFLSRLEPALPILVVVPTSLIFNWQREVERFLPDWKIHVHHSSQRLKDAKQFTEKTILITTYATLRLDLPLLSSLQYEAVILDEAQAIKNPNTQTFYAVKQLKARFRLEMTGTPVENHLQELWAHFHFLIPDLFGEESAFAAEVQASTSDMRFLKRIKKKIRPFLLRRKKEEVAKDLPEKIEQVIWLDMGQAQRQVYDQFLSGIKGGLIKKIEKEGAGKHRMEILEAILRLRQICCHPLLVTAGEEQPCCESVKLEALIQDLETIREENGKVLVYSQFTSMLQLIGKNLTKKQLPYLYLDGSTVNREKVVHEFQTNPAASFFLISLKAGGMGLNLTAADYVFLYDPWWNDAVENQAIDRAHRIGRKDTVIAKRYVILESIEEKMMKLKATKKTLASELIDDDLINNLALNEEDLMFLLS